MKEFCTLIASALAASTVVLSSASASASSGDRNVAFYPCSGEASKDAASSSYPAASTGNKFAPRFDGLKFIETLVTAHR